MPLYEYSCGACGLQFERIRKFSDPPLTVCPDCGGAVEKLISSPAIQFKGSGFYITDYARAGQKSERSADSGSASSGETAKGAGSKDAGSKDTAAKDGGPKDSGSKASGSSDSSSGSAGTSSSRNDSGSRTSASKDGAGGSSKPAPASGTKS